jgi:carbon monoxide dehydrogenase subunit G
MKINNEFTVHAPIDRAWALLTDVEAIAPCMPGAQLTGVRPADDSAAGAVGEVYEGKVKVKMGPVVAEYKGTAVFIEKDDEKYRGVIDAKGRDSRGQGNASAVITVQLREVGGETTVGIDTDLKISGKIAQFGAGMIQEVSEKLLGQFVGCLEGKLAAPAEAAAEPIAAEPVAGSEPVAAPAGSTTGSAAAPAPTTPASTTPAGSAEGDVPAEAALTSTITPATEASATVSAATVAAAISATPTASSTAAANAAPLNGAAAAPTTRRPFQASPEPEALDLLDLAGGAAFKRLIPVAVAGVAIVVAVIYFLTRR